MITKFNKQQLPADAVFDNVSTANPSNTYVRQNGNWVQETVGGGGLAGSLSFTIGTAPVQTILSFNGLTAQSLNFRSGQGVSISGDPSGWIQFLHQNRPISGVDAGGTGQFVTSVEVDNVMGHVFRTTKGNETQLSGGASAIAGKYVSGVTVSGHAVTVTQENLPSVSTEVKNNFTVVNSHFNTYGLSFHNPPDSVMINLSINTISGEIVDVTTNSQTGTLRNAIGQEYNGNGGNNLNFNLSFGNAWIFDWPSWNMLPKPDYLVAINTLIAKELLIVDPDEYRDLANWPTTPPTNLLSTNSYVWYNGKDNAVLNDGTQFDGAPLAYIKINSPTDVDLIQYPFNYDWKTPAIWWKKGKPKYLLVTSTRGVPQQINIEGLDQKSISQLVTSLFPTTLPNPQALTVTKGGASPVTYDGSIPINIDIPTDVTSGNFVKIQSPTTQIIDSNLGLTPQSTLFVNDNISSAIKYEKLIITSLNQLQVGMNLRGQNIVFNTSKSPTFYSGVPQNTVEININSSTSNYIRISPAMWSPPGTGQGEISSNFAGTYPDVYIYNGQNFQGWIKNTITIPNDQDYIITKIDSSANLGWNNVLQSNSVWQFSDIDPIVLYENLVVGDTNLQTTIKTKSNRIIVNNIEKIAYLSDISTGGVASSVANPLVITTNNGSTEGVDKFTFNGSTIKNVNFISGIGIDLINISGGITINHPQHTGEVIGATSLTIINNAVTNAKLAQAPAYTFKGNNTGATANVQDISVSDVKIALSINDKVDKISSNPQQLNTNLNFSKNNIIGWDTFLTWDNSLKFNTNCISTSESIPAIITQIPVGFNFAGGEINNYLLFFNEFPLFSGKTGRVEFVNGTYIEVYGTANTPFGHIKFVGLDSYEFVMYDVSGFGGGGSLTMLPMLSIPIDQDYIVSSNYIDQGLLQVDGFTKWSEFHILLQPATNGTWSKINIGNKHTPLVLLTNANDQNTRIEVISGSESNYLTYQSDLPWNNYNIFNTHNDIFLLPGTYNRFTENWGDPVVSSIIDVYFVKSPKPTTFVFSILSGTIVPQITFKNYPYTNASNKGTIYIQKGFGGFQAGNTYEVTIIDNQISFLQLIQY